MTNDGRICAAPDCGQPRKYVVYCGKHYFRMWRHGNLDGIAPHDPPDVRFDRKVKWSDSGCWLWTGHLTAAGYGRFPLEHGTPPLYAHRYAYERAHGPIPPGLVVMHSCDNPPCVNPAHLSAGTQRDNVLDMMQKGRGNPGGIKGRRRA